jgi:hypothetical protein
MDENPYDPPKVETRRTSRFAKGIAIIMLLAAPRVLGALAVLRIIS